MEITLKNIYCHGESNSMVYISVDVRYGWEGEMYKDTIQINYNGKKDDAYITVKIDHPGIGSVIERIIAFTSSLEIKGKLTAELFIEIIDRMAEKFELRYDPEKVKSVLAQFNN